MFISLTMETLTQPVETQSFSNDTIEDSQEETDETDPLRNNNTPAEKENACTSFIAKTWRTCIEVHSRYGLEIHSCIILLIIFILMWKFGPTLTSEYKQANEHLNGTVSHSPNYAGFSKRQSLVCNRSISIGTVLATIKTFLTLF